MSEGRARRRPRLTADVVEDAGDWSFLEDATALVEAAASQVAADEDIAPEPASFTLVLSDDAVEGYARNLLARYLAYRKLIDEGKVTLTQNEGFAAFEERIRDIDLAVMVAGEEKLDAAELRERNLTAVNIDWQQIPAAVWRSHGQLLKPVKSVDPIRLASLVGIERQKQQLVDNTERFVRGLPANNALLWGGRGTGKSSLIKALLNEYRDRGLRLLEVNRHDLLVLPEIIDAVRDLAFRFILFITRYEPEVTFSYGEFRIMEHRADYRDIGVMLDNCVKFAFMAGPADLVKDHPGDIQLRFKRLVSEQ